MTSRATANWMNHALLNKDRRYLVAVSFGPDSMALLHMMFQSGYDIAVAHVNYRKRPEAASEQTGLEQFCLEHDIPLYVYDVGTERPAGNFQAWARRIRYRFFAQVSAAIEATALVTAHHMDDHMETAIMQINRKTMAICMGIADSSVVNGVKIIRPLLDIRKRNLVTYCNENRIPYAIDTSNLTDAYERNRVRHHVVEAMSDLDVRIMISRIEAQNKAIKRSQAEVAREFIDGKLPVSQISAFNDLELFLALHHLINPTIPGHPISRSLIKEIRTIASSERAHWLRHLKSGYWLMSSYDEITVLKLTEAPAYSYTYESPSRDETPYFFMDFTTGSHRDILNPADYPITIRAPRQGDTISINGAQKPAPSMP